MEQPAKRFKLTEESTIADIASSIDHIANSLKSISESYSELLRVNKTVVTYLRNAEKHKDNYNINLDSTVTTLQRTSIEETH
ncbi:hypothetical protein X777_10959 [Ooceraea biroi]|uniref:Uncharacterized protein n=1 Tax=Ooceraea biroi TaxID=2015173 RepID=A0A026W3N6_OOCBI|nr:hypothetical protein X777_10959 [Ooceraea biroi]